MVEILMDRHRIKVFKNAYEKLQKYIAEAGTSEKTKEKPPALAANTVLAFKWQGTPDQLVALHQSLEEAGLTKATRDVFFGVFGLTDFMGNAVWLKGTRHLVWLIQCLSSPSKKGHLLQKPTNNTIINCFVNSKGHQYKERNLIQTTAESGLYPVGEEPYSTISDIVSRVRALQ